MSGSKASRTGSASAPGGVANTGVIGSLVVGPGPARSRYLDQVRRIAPDDLIGREAELAELAEFCTARTSKYAWWRAPAWTGKSALLSWFVLHPPAGVRIVSFFVTARLPGQSDWRAYCDNVLVQLCALLDEPMPFVTDATRESEVLGRLAEAAAACKAAGDKLVLVVDGLDEDRITDGYSIAGMLPVKLPDGMRVVVAGRSDPPVPPGVPVGHPLRNGKIVRLLGPSDAAHAVRVDMERDLKHLVRSEVDLLGLVVAAGGGLSAADLAELTDRMPWEIEDLLLTVAGRSFSRRASEWRRTDIYLLGHEELAATAVELLGPKRLAAYRDRLHAWAERYQEAGWPQDTPEYLLLGYFQLLRTIGDPARMIACATDAARRERMVWLSGGQFAAVAEIKAVQDTLVGHERPDLHTMARLAVRHNLLTEHHYNIPADLPVAWARLGHFERALNLTRAMHGWLEAGLTRIALAAARTGRVDQALTLVQSLVDAGRPWPAELLLGTPPWVGETGKRLALSTTLSVQALPILVRAEIDRGERDRALEMAEALIAEVRTYRSELVLAGTLARVAYAVSSADRPWAARLAEEAATVAESIPDEDDQIAVLPEVIKAARSIGDDEWADRLVEDWEPEIADRELPAFVAVITDPDRVGRLAARISDPEERLKTVLWQVELVRRQGGDVRSLIDSFEDASHRSRAWTSLIAETSEYEQYMVTSETTARSIADDKQRSAALAALAVAVATAGDSEVATRLAIDAEAAAVSGVVHQRRSSVAASLAEAASTIGDLPLAGSMATQAASLARAVHDPRERDVALSYVVPAVLAAGGGPEIAEEITSADMRDLGLASGARWLATAGRPEQADALLTMTSPGYHVPPDIRHALWISRITQAATAGEFARAEGMVPPTRSDERIWGLVALAKAVEPDRANQYVDEALDLIDTHGNEYLTPYWLIDLARAVKGDPDRTERIGQALEVFVERPARSPFDEQVRVMAKVIAGDEAGAEAAALALADRQSQTAAFQSLATGTELARTGRPIARLLHVGHWADALGVIAAEFPDLLATIADEFNQKS